MRSIAYSGKFKKDLKRYKHQKSKIEALGKVIRSLESTGRVPEEYVRSRVFDFFVMRSRVFDLFPKDKNRETEVSQRGFRFFLHTKKNRQLFGRIKRIAYLCGVNLFNNFKLYTYETEKSKKLCKIVQNVCKCRIF
jgi:hypothetical protein